MAAATAIAIAGEGLINRISAAETILDDHLKVTRPKKSLQVIR